MLRLLIQEAKNPLRYKISKTEKNGKDGWNTINTINAYESFIEGTEHFFVYRAANPKRYCLSKEKITDNNWEYYYDFYCKESEIDERIPIHKFKNLEDSKPPKKKYRKSLQEKCVYPFLKIFVEKTNLNINIENYEIYHSLNHQEKDIYVRKESHDINFKNPQNIQLFIDSLDDKLMKNKVKNYYHIPYGVISYYLRDFKEHSYFNLLKPLNQIYSKKKIKFCDYIFLNKTYRNGVKRFKFYQVLNNLKYVDNFKTNYRFGIDMYQKIVKDHEPYKFSIAFENDIVDGWITEKIFNSFLACCIPIYDGTDDIYKYFNKGSFINAKDFDSLEELAIYVVKVDSDENLYNQYMNKAPTTLEKLKKLFWWENDINNKISELSQNITTHKDCYNHILDTLNKNNIKFVIIRGFKYLPLKPDTDLDIVIHPDSYNKFIEIYSKLKNDNLIRIQPSAKYIENDKEVFYTPLFTANHLKDGKHLPGNYYRFDTYSDLFFYKDGEGKGKNAIICNPLFKKYLFDNLIKIDNYYIPDSISEIILLIYRNLYDKRGKWSGKHIQRINELLPSINKDDFGKISNYCFTSKQNIYKYLITKNFDKISKPNQKLNLFIIRKKGMEREIIENILTQIENEYQILDKILININNKKKFYSNFYGNYDKHADDIEKNNDNQCLAIITNNPDDINPNELKQKIRKQYIKFYPPLGNIIHSSDSSNDCEKELEMLFNENIDNFKNIGTYYSQKKI